MSEPKHGTIHQISVSSGGVPKHAIEIGEVSASGLTGDIQAKPDIHGAPHQAISLLALEIIESLAAEGHPIEPGSTGENVTTRGLDWERLDPGTRLQLGSEVTLEITSYAAPCRTIAGSFSDGRFSRLSQLKTGRSRLYAEVVRGGVIRPGDAIEIREPAARTRREENTMQLAYVNIYVTDLERSVAFFEKTLGLGLQFSDASFGYASLDAGPVRIGLAQIDPEDEDSRALVARQTGIGFGVTDLKAEHARLEASGVKFPMKPSKQPWGGYMALFTDPDENIYYLDELQPEA